MRHIETFLIAKTEERESATEDGVYWWKEYRLQRVDDQWSLQLRYMGRVGDKVYARVHGRIALFTDPSTIWETYYTGYCQTKVVDEHMGDSDFYKAISLHPLHADAVEKSRLIREKNEKIHLAKQRADAAYEHLHQWKLDNQRSFDKRTRGKDGEAYAKAHERAKKKLKPEYDRLREEAKKLHDEYDALQRNGTA